MDLQFYGANALKFSAKKAVITVDDTLADLGLKSITKETDIALYTEKRFAKGSIAKHVIDGPGEYEIAEVTIRAIALPLHRDEKEMSTGYVLHTDEATIAVLGHVSDGLTDQQLEAIGMVDVLVLPVGGFGYTLDAVGARKLMKKIEPKIVVLTHYADKRLNYEVPQADLETISKELSVEPIHVESLKLKGFELEGALQIYVIDPK